MAEDLTRVLLVEDNEGDVVLVRRLLSEEPGFKLSATATLAEGIERLAGEDADVLLLDLGLPDSQGLETAMDAMAAAPTVPVVVLTGNDDDRAAAEAIAGGAQDYLVKGAFSAATLRRTIRYSIERKRAEAALLESQEELRAVQEQLVLAQKMEAVGRLAGGVAHDFNNLLTGIGGFAGFARDRLTPGSQAYNDLSQALTLCDRAAALTRQLLAFSRRQRIEPVALDLNELIANQTRMLRHLLGEDVNLQFIPSRGLGSVRADPGQIEQVIMNLAVNARDAMPDGGRVSIETANVELGRDYAAAHPGVAPGPYVMIAVADTGTGMDAETLCHIFEPFFTTKDVNKGTGLGLSTVYGIVKQHEGSVYVHSEPGAGTTFKVYLPCVSGPAQEPRAPSHFIVGGTETVLLVEDDEAVRDVGRRHLEGLGYTVLVARNARQAREVAAGHGSPIHLLLTDVVMPGQNGRELAASLLSARPGLKALFMSGHTDHAVVNDGLLGQSAPFLQKPFERYELADKVRQALDGPAGR